MSEPEHEDTDEAVGAPVDEPGPSDDETDAEEAEEAETPPSESPEALQAKSDKDVDRANRALEKEATAHANRISKIMGEDAQDLIPCELCWPLTPGFHWPVEAMPLDEAQKAAILAAIGQGADAGPELQPASGVKTCPKCLGNGQLVFPTFVEHTRVQQCPACLGSGYVNEDQPQAQVYDFSQGQGGITAGDTPVSTYSLPDQWGRPIGHPHYGIAPAQVGT